jgi:hypothetical protein
MKTSISVRQNAAGASPEWVMFLGRKRHLIGTPREKGP